MSLAELLADAMISEIRADIESGAVPHSVSSFTELHDYVDANEYGNTALPWSTENETIYNQAIAIVNEWLFTRG